MEGRMMEGKYKHMSEEEFLTFFVQRAQMEFPGSHFKNPRFEWVEREEDGEDLFVIDIYEEEEWHTITTPLTSFVTRVIPH
jgi:hypothetical protein